MLENLNSPWVFGSILSMSVAVCFLIWKAGVIVIEKLGITIGQKNKNTIKSPHANCPHSRDIMDIIHRTAEHYEKIQAMKNSIIREQMRYYEEIEEEVAGELKRIFIKLLSSKRDSNEPLVDCEDYKMYVLILRVIGFELKSYIRNCFTSNHYITYTIEGQNDYVDKKKNIIIQKVTEALNIYWRGSVVSRVEIYKANKEHIKSFEDRVEEMFHRAFLITRETYERIEREEKTYQDYIRFIIGE